jgi:glucose/arabinose dehydrogenase
VHLKLSRHALAIVLLCILPACSPPSDPDPDPGDNPPPPAAEIFTAADGTRFAVQTFMSRVQIPWGLAFAPDGRLFFTERPGRVRIVQNGTLVQQPAAVLGDVRAEGEGGLLGLAFHPAFATNRFVYVVYTAVASNGRAVNRVVRFRELNNTLAEAAVIIDNIIGADIHDGGRIRFGPDGKLYVTMGDAANASLSQDLASLNGKILRLNDDGSTPDDNPFRLLVFSYGHRNPQGLDWHPQTGELWATEHGASGNDELNVVRSGRNYGWPLIENGQTAAGMESPVAFYTPSIAPSGASFYTGTSIAGFRNNLFFTALRGTHLHRVRFDPTGRTITATERLLDGRYGRLRDVITGPDGALYVATNNRDGRGNAGDADDRILRITAAN